MKVCRNCLEILVPLTSYADGRPVATAYITCCDWPNPIEVEDGELESYQEAYNETGLDLEDLTDKEETILKYLNQEGRIIYGDTEIFEGESADTMVHDKQLGFDFL